MLTQIEVYSAESISLPTLILNVDGANANPVQLLNVEGLGPVKADINTTPYGSFDGESFSGSSIGKRNIVLTLGLNPNWQDQSMASLRAMLYEYFMPKLRVTLAFQSTHLPYVNITGYVESFEPNMFSKDPEIQVSILFPLPNFVAIDPVVVTGTVGIDPVTPTVIAYEGTVETGFVLDVVESVANPTFTGNLIVRNTARSIDIFTAAAVINATHHFRLSTVPGDKYVKDLDAGGGLNENRLPYVVGVPVWAQLYPGNNNFSVISAESGQAWTLTYTPQYGGI